LNQFGACRKTPPAAAAAASGSNERVNETSSPCHRFFHNFSLSLVPLLRSDEERRDSKEYEFHLSAFARGQARENGN
jgi:hypothetical protein